MDTAGTRLGPKNVGPLETLGHTHALQSSQNKRAAPRQQRTRRRLLDHRRRRRLWIAAAAAWTRQETPAPRPQQPFLLTAGNPSPAASPHFNLFISATRFSSIEPLDAAACYPMLRCFCSHELLNACAAVEGLSVE